MNAGCKKDLHSLIGWAIVIRKDDESLHHAAYQLVQV